MSPLRWRIFVCFMAKSAFWFFSALAPYKGVGPIQCVDEICSVPPPLHTLKIWEAGVYSPRSYGAEFVFFCLFVRHATMLAQKAYRRFVYALNFGGTGISSPDKSPPGQKTPRTNAPPDNNPPAPDTQQAATYSIAAVAGNWTILALYRTAPVFMIWVVTSVIFRNNAYKLFGLSSGDFWIKLSVGNDSWQFTVTVSLTDKKVQQSWQTSALAMHLPLAR